MNWRELPCIRIAMSLSLGILSYKLVHLQEGYAFTLVLFLFSLFIFSENFQLNYKQIWLRGLFINVLLLVLGNHLAQVRDQYEWKDHFRHDLQEYSAFVIKVEEITEASGTQKIVGQVLAIQDENKVLNLSKGRISFQAKNLASKLLTGDIIYLTGVANEFEPVKNPLAFDLKSFYAQKQLFHKLQTESIVVLQNSEAHYLIFRDGLRRKLLAVLDEYVPSEQENAVAKALLLGHKSGLDETTKTAYADTGALHILAVSGLHVGILCLILLSFFKYIRSENLVFKFLKLTFLLSCLYFYCSLTGSTASVMRASVMYGCLLIGNEINRYSNIYNTIAGSALIILWLDPLMMNTVSFQLSYLALIGIVYFQPKLYALWIPKNRFIDFIWQLVCVSIAAQLSTFPISVYYFNQLPLLSWLSGIMAVPAAFGIFSLGVILFVSNFTIPFLLFPIGKILNFVLWLNNEFIFFLQKIPYNKLVDLHLDRLDLWIIYTVLFLIMLAITLRNKRLIAYALVICLLLSIKLITYTINLNNCSKFVIYHCPKASLIDFHSGRQLYSIKSENLMIKQEKYAAEAFRNKHRSLYESEDSFGSKHFKKDGLIIFNGKSIFQLNDQTKDSLSHKIEVDILLIQENVSCDKREILHKIKTDLVVLDGSNSWSYNKKWASFLNEQAMKHHDILKNGALVIELE